MCFLQRMWVGLPRPAVKEDKEENDALAWKGVAIATLYAFCGAEI